MKRYIVLLTVVAAVTVLSCADCSLAAFPNIRSGLEDGVGDASASFRLYQGWYNNQLAWYICTETNNIRLAQSEWLVFTPKLDSAAVAGAAPVYYVTNFDQGPVFSARPGQDEYSGLWVASYITWNPGAVPRPITNASPAGPDNPQGIPVDLVTVTPTPPCVCPGVGPTVLDCPIVALGPLDGPWHTGSTWNPTAYPYRLLQVVRYNSLYKMVTLPIWYVYCNDPTTNRVMVRALIIPDVADPALAALLRANLAPNLFNVPAEDTQAFWVMRAPKPPAQLPVIEECPMFRLGQFAYFQPSDHPNVYSPVMRYILLHRNIPPWTLVNNDDYLLSLIQSGGLEVVSRGQRINAPVLGAVKVVW